MNEQCLQELWGMYQARQMGGPVLALKEWPMDTICQSVGLIALGAISFALIWLYERLSGRGALGV